MLIEELLVVLHAFGALGLLVDVGMIIGWLLRDEVQKDRDAQALRENPPLERVKMARTVLCIGMRRRQFEEDVMHPLRDLNRLERWSIGYCFSMDGTRYIFVSVPEKAKGWDQRCTTYIDLGEYGDFTERMSDAYQDTKSEIRRYLRGESWPYFEPREIETAACDSR